MLKRFFCRIISFFGYKKCNNKVDEPTEEVKDWFSKETVDKLVVDHREDALTEENDKNSQVSGEELNKSYQKVNNERLKEMEDMIINATKVLSPDEVNTKSESNESDKKIWSYESNQMTNNANTHFSLRFDDMDAFTNIMDKTNSSNIRFIDISNGNMYTEEEVNKLQSLENIVEYLGKSHYGNNPIFKSFVQQLSYDSDNEFDQSKNTFSGESSIIESFKALPGVELNPNNIVIEYFKDDNLDIQLNGEPELEIINDITSTTPLEKVEKKTTKSPKRENRRTTSKSSNSNKKAESKASNVSSDKPNSKKADKKVTTTKATPKGKAEKKDDKKVTTTKAEKKVVTSKDSKTDTKEKISKATSNKKVTPKKPKKDSDSKK